MLYIDALRGVTMFLVVYHHVIGVCNGGTLVFEKALLFRMPLFFLISGFVAYKSLDFWTPRNTGKRIVDKIRAQVIPTAIFFCTYFYFIEGCNPFKLFAHYGWGKFWFTIVLFEFLLLYFVINFLTRKSKFLNTITFILASILSLVVYFEVTKKGPAFGWFYVYGLSRYFVFFCAGSYARRYIDKINAVFESKWPLLLTFVLIVIQMCYFHYASILPSVYKTIVNDWTLPICGLVFVFGLFTRFRSFFTDTSKVTKCLTFVGRRTLDVYLVHYFFIKYVPVLHKCIVGWGIGDKDRLPMFVLALIVLMLCLLISAVLRKNKFLGRLLFFAKYPAKA